ncbi:16S rRNA (guanine(527)-N(7))-methyltransferase RsmG [Edaphobacter flagellatus]|uniref:16S rRNA (guanine(527)-N(7))-methyltransferase RsmG n=1 Tax=Edaphobacter flagellatus TaxID=1933044 RepID=UPI0021B30FE4|nr:16S rRNA (guanine(527)-N(7))-methyltransferase RsmG [Edaphobacter flagellatus]
MPVLTESEIERLLAPYTNQNATLAAKMVEYLDLLVRWNARTNLTAIRTPEEMVRRHFGESLFAAAHLGDPLPDTLLDLGSGAGFPGLPIALARPEIAVTLAESQNKKSTFLREAVRTLGVKNVEVWAGRAENLPEGRQFHTVTLRAVDDMAAALAIAEPLVRSQMLLLTTATPGLPAGFSVIERLPLPESESGVLLRATRD